LPRAVLEIPTIACLNLTLRCAAHRGAAPARRDRRRRSRDGNQRQSMDEGLDTGDVLLQSESRSRPNETGGSLHDRLAAIAQQR